VILLPFAEACERVGLTPSAVRARLKGRTVCAPPFTPLRGTNGHLYVKEEDVTAYLHSLPSIREPGLSRCLRLPRGLSLSEEGTTHAITGTTEHKSGLSLASRAGGVMEPLCGRPRPPQKPRWNGADGEENEMGW
jgi:hypothetical protein